MVFCCLGVRKKSVLIPHWEAQYSLALWPGLDVSFVADKCHAVLSFNRCCCALKYSHFFLKKLNTFHCLILSCIEDPSISWPLHLHPLTTLPLMLHSHPGVSSSPCHISCSFPGRLDSKAYGYTFVTPDDLKAVKEVEAD